MSRGQCASLLIVLHTLCDGRTPVLSAGSRQKTCQLVGLMPLISCGL